MYFVFKKNTKINLEHNLCYTIPLFLFILWWLICRHILQKKVIISISNCEKISQKKKTPSQTEDISLLIVGQSYGQQQRCIFSMVFTASLFLKWAPCIIAFLFCRISEPHCTSFSSIKLICMLSKLPCFYLPQFRQDTPRRLNAGKSCLALCKPFRIMASRAQWCHCLILSESLLHVMFFFAVD